MKTKRLGPRQVGLLLLLALGIASGVGVWWLSRPAALPREFSGAQAYTHVLAQMNFGPRVTGTAANRAAGDYILARLQADHWQTEAQTFTYRLPEPGGTPVRNLIGRANVGRGPVIIVGAHYDSRRRADQDAAHPQDPVPGANDGASGVAVLLELARTLDLSKVPNEVWLAFFDAEDNGDLDGWDWLVGSTYMAQHLSARPQAMVLLDMVGDADQQFYYDLNSNRDLAAQLWTVAAGLGYGQNFIPAGRYAMLDDHTPFAQQGIPAVDIIDFDYGPHNSYWHTTADTADKVSADSLERIGRTMAAFLQSGGK